MPLLNEVIARNLKRFGLRIERIETPYGEFMVKKGASGETLLTEMKPMRNITSDSYGLQSRRAASRGLRGPFEY
jgi:hypothetical protein